ncbi:hypothetical protein FRC03_001532 [Tulasnella sp. 419]|nr:hypothetical protein FRC03_001532 [Tulasnella sp. 419]
MTAEPAAVIDSLPEFKPSLYKPDSIAPCLSIKEFPYEKFMATSTLPLWRSRKNVRLTYDPIEGTSISEAFLDTVTYNSAKDSKGKKPSKILGADYLQSIQVSVDGQKAAKEGGDVEHSNGTRWKWRGKGWLAIATSHWQVLGYHIDGGDDDWVVIYFGKSLFTPPGMDILVRNPEKFDKAKVKTLIETCQSNEDENVKMVSQGFYDVARDE